MNRALDLTDVITTVVRQAPQWVRADLMSSDAARRTRAEDALAAIIANAITEAQAIVEKSSRH